MDTTLENFRYDLVEHNVVKFECQIKIFFYPTDFISDIRVHFSLVCLRLPTMIDQTFIEFLEFFITQLLSDLILLSCSLQRHFILLLSP